MHALAYGACAVCQQLFGFNPVRVPSVTIKGAREPICRECVKIANLRRKALGLAPIVPLPDAYEPIDETELPAND